MKNGAGMIKKIYKGQSNSQLALLETYMIYEMVKMKSKRRMKRRRTPRTVTLIESKDFTALGYGFCGSCQDMSGVRN